MCSCGALRHDEVDHVKITRRDRFDRTIVRIKKDEQYGTHRRRVVVWIYVYIVSVFMVHTGMTVWVALE